MENQTEYKNNYSCRNISQQKQQLKIKTALLFKKIIEENASCRRKQINQHNQTKTKYSILNHIFYYITISKQNHERIAQTIVKNAYFHS